MVVFAESVISISVLEDRKRHSGSTQITLYEAPERRQTVVGIVGTMMAKEG
jgi:hypothetical protein